MRNKIENNLHKNQIKKFLVEEKITNKEFYEIFYKVFLSSKVKEKKYTIREKVKNIINRLDNYGSMRISDLDISLNILDNIILKMKNR